MPVPTPALGDPRDDLKRYLAGEYAAGAPLRWRDRSIAHADVAAALRHLGYRERRILDLRYAEQHLSVFEVGCRLNICSTTLHRYEKIAVDRLLDVLGLVEAPPSPS